MLQMMPVSSVVVHHAADPVSTHPLRAEIMYQYIHGIYGHEREVQPGLKSKRDGWHALAFSLPVLLLSVIQRGGATGFNFDALLLGGFCETRLEEYKHES